MKAILTKGLIASGKTTWRHMLKTSLKRELAKYLENYPEDVPEFMKIITDSLEQYKVKIDEDRDRKASEAVHNMFMYINTKKDLKTKEKKDRFILWHIEAMFIRFPRCNSNGDSIMANEVFRYFVALCQEVNYFKEHGDFIRETRGEDIYLWLKKLKKGGEIYINEL